jgi:hypothetical protein
MFEVTGVDDSASLRDPSARFRAEMLVEWGTVAVLLLMTDD